MKRTILSILSIILLLTAFIACSPTSDSPKETSDFSSLLIGTWQDVNHYNAYYVFKADGTGLYVTTRNINNEDYVDETHSYSYSLDVATKSINLVLTDGKESPSQILSNVKIENGELAFEHKGQNIHCIPTGEARWFVEISANGIEESESKYGLNYKCNRFGGNFSVKLNAIYVWHESCPNYSLNMIKDNISGNNARFHMSCENEYHQEYKFEIDPFRYDNTDQYKMLVSLTNDVGEELLNTYFYITQDGTDFSNPSIVGTWSRFDYDYSSEPK